MMTEDVFSDAVKSLRNRNSRLEREGDYWAADEKERLQKMFDSGVGLSEIAIRLQRTEPAVFQQAEKMDLYHRKDHPRRRRNGKKPYQCPCPTCGVDHSLCPRHDNEEEGH